MKMRLESRLGKLEARQKPQDDFAALDKVLSNHASTMFLMGELTLEEVAKRNGVTIEQYQGWRAWKEASAKVAGEKWEQEVHEPWMRERDKELARLEREDPESQNPQKYSAPEDSALGAAHWWYYEKPLHYPEKQSDGGEAGR